jgi:hypothetical protein
MEIVSIKNFALYVAVFQPEEKFSFKDCGYENQNAEHVYKRFTWLVRIDYSDDKKTKRQCFGAIISNNTVLTSIYSRNNKIMIYK